MAPIQGPEAPADVDADLSGWDWRRASVPRTSFTGAQLPLGEWPSGSGIRRTTLQSTPAEFRAWRRRAHRSAVGEGARARNEYLVAPPEPGWHRSSPSRQRSSSMEEVSSKRHCDDSDDDMVLPVEVKLNIYDLFRDTNAATGVLGFGAFHAGIEIFGIEWSYGATPPEGWRPLSGVYPAIPRHSGVGFFRETLPLGYSKCHRAHDVWQLALRLACEWLGEHYHVLDHNCLDFCATFASHLGVDQVPDWVTRLPRGASAVISALSPALDIGLPLAPNVEQTSEEQESSISNGPRHETLLSTSARVVLEFTGDFQWAYLCMVRIETQLLLLAVSGT